MAPLTSHRLCQGRRNISSRMNKSARPSNIRTARGPRAVARSARNVLPPTTQACRSLRTPTTGGYFDVRLACDDRCDATASPVPFLRADEILH